MVFASNLYSISIWLLVFATGWFVMLTELVAARVLAPYFGNSIYVWGSVIAIFLVTLAIGYAFGGRLTRKSISAFVPITSAAAAGLYVACTPLYQDLLSGWLCKTGLELKWGALFASIILYGPPMVLLGSVSPYCIQLATKVHTEAGHHAGLLYAISTVGSFGGSLVTAFYLIPMLPLTAITVIAGITLAAIALIVALVILKRTLLAVGLTAILAVVAVILGCRHNGSSWHALKAYQYPLHNYLLSNTPPSEMRPILDKAQAEARKEAEKFMQMPATTIFERETPYHHIHIYQEGPVRKLVFGKAQFRSPQSVIDMRDLRYHSSEYTMLSFAAMLYQPKPKRVCIIGIGGAVIPRALELCVPGVKIDAVEIDPTIVKLAQKYFYWRPSKNTRIYIGDGRWFLSCCITNKKPKYDWIILDAYSDDYVPFHLTTVEFFNIVKRALAPNGVVASNLAVTDDLYGCEARTLHAIFGNATSFIGHRSGNIILVAQKGRSKSLTVEEAAKAAKRVKLPPNSGIDMRHIVSCLAEQMTYAPTGPILSDRWSPVEILLKRQ